MVEKKLAQALSALLAKAVEPGDNIRMDACDAWDSVKHIEIVMTVEDLFSVSFAPEDIPTLTTQRRLAAAVQQLLQK